MKTFHIKFAVSLVVSFLLFNCIVIFFSIDEQMAWVPLYKNYKYTTAANTQTPKILLQGGSSMLYGLRAEIVEQELKLPAINLGINGGLSVRFFFEEAQKIAKSGDTIVFAPEYNVYGSDMSVYTKLDYEYFKLQGPKAIKDFPLDTIFTYAWQANVLDGVMTRLTQLLRVLLKGVYGRPPELNTHGDYSACHAAASTVKETLINIVGNASSIKQSPAQLAPLLNFAKWCAENNIRFFVTFPNLMKHPFYDDPSWLDASKSLVQTLKDSGLQVLGEPKDFVFERSMFCDSNYHLNSNGGVLRTKQFLANYGATLLNSANSP